MATTSGLIAQEARVGLAGQQVAAWPAKRVGDNLFARAPSGDLLRIIFRAAEKAPRGRLGFRAGSVAVVVVAGPARQWTTGCCAADTTRGTSVAPSARLLRHEMNIRRVNIGGRREIGLAGERAEGHFGDKLEIRPAASLREPAGG